MVKIELFLKKILFFVVCVFSTISARSATETHFNTQPNWICTSNCWMISFEYKTIVPDDNKWLLDILFSFDVETEDGIYPLFSDEKPLSGIDPNDPIYNETHTYMRSSSNFFAFGYYDGLIRSCHTRWGIDTYNGKPFGTAPLLHIGIEEKINICKIKNIALDAKGTFEGGGVILEKITFNDFQRNLTYVCDVSAGESLNIPSFCEEKPKILGLDFVYEKTIDFIYIKTITDKNDHYGHYHWEGASIPDSYKDRDEFIDGLKYVEGNEYYVTTQYSDCSPQDTLWFHFEKNKNGTKIVGKGYICEGDNFTPISIPPTADNFSTEISFETIPKEKVFYLDTCFTSFVWKGNNINEPGCYQAVSYEHGCKVNNLLYVSRMEDSTIVEYDTISYDQSPFANSNGYRYLTSNYYDGHHGIESEFIFKKNKISESGCVNPIELHVFRTNKMHVNKLDSFCIGSFYTWGDTIINTPGDYTKTFKIEKISDSNNKNQVTIDSIVHLSLISADKYNIYDIKEICKGDSLEIGGLKFADDGLYEINLKSAGGCDSIINLKLKTLHYSDTTYVNLCQGEDFKWHDQILYKDGLYSKHFISTSGCDSSLFLSLTVNPIYNDTLEYILCEGQKLEYKGLSYNKPTTIIDRMESIHGCDSINVIRIKGKKTIIIDSTTICEGEIYNFLGENLSSSGLYQKTIEDSVCGNVKHILYLTTNKTKFDTINVDICHGDNYQYKEQKLEETGLYRDTLISFSGCDSIHIVNLNVWPIFNDTIVATTEGYYTQNGFYEKENGVYMHINTSVHGCDSITVLKLNTIEHRYENICFGDKYTKDGFDIDSAGSYEKRIDETDTYRLIYLDLSVHPTYHNTLSDTICEGESHNIDYKVENLAPGSYIYYEQLKSYVGCDSLVSHNINILPTTRFDTVVIICSDEVFLYNGEVYDDTENIQYASNKKNYCETRNINIKKFESPVISNIKRDDLGFQIILEQNMDDSDYKFSIDSMILEYNSIKTINDGLHKAYVVDKNGCSDSLEFNVKSSILPMNFFTPNGDGMNDLWQIINIESFPEAIVKIFNRNGCLLKTYSHYDNINNGWDGYYEGVPMPSTDYWYEISEGGLDKIYIGHFTLIRK